MYYNKFFLSAISLAILSSLSGCAEVSALTKDISSSVGQGVSTMVKDVNKVLTTPTSTTANQTQRTNTIPTTDMVYLLGWMEDACQHDVPPYDKISDRFFTFRDSVVNMAESRIHPRSQWSAQYRNQIQDVIRRDDDGTTVYAIRLKNAYYRNQPLAAIEMNYMGETDYGNARLVFAPSANIPSIIGNFKARKIEGYEGSYVSGAKYSASENSLDCEW